MHSPVGSSDRPVSPFMLMYADVPTAGPVGCGADGVNVCHIVFEKVVSCCSCRYKLFSFVMSYCNLCFMSATKYIGLYTSIFIYLFLYLRIYLFI